MSYVNSTSILFGDDRNSHSIPLGISGDRWESPEMSAGLPATTVGVKCTQDMQRVRGPLGPLGGTLGTAERSIFSGWW